MGGTTPPWLAEKRDAVEESMLRFLGRFLVSVRSTYDVRICSAVKLYRLAVHIRYRVQPCLVLRLYYSPVR